MSQTTSTWMIWKLPRKLARCMHISRSIYIHESIHPIIYILISLSACLQSACLPVCLTACLLVCLSACLPVCLSACLPVCLSACPPVGFSACLPASQSALVAGGQAGERAVEWTGGQAGRRAGGQAGGCEQVHQRTRGRGSPGFRSECGVGAVFLCEPGAEQGFAGVNKGLQHDFAQPIGVWSGIWGWGMCFCANRTGNGAKRASPFWVAEQQQHKHKEATRTAEVSEAFGSDGRTRPWPMRKQHSSHHR